MNLNQMQKLDIDLESQTITRQDGSKIQFHVDAFRRHCLLNGLDDIGLTMQKAEKIAFFESKRKSTEPWMDGAAQAVGELAFA